MRNATIQQQALGLERSYWDALLNKDSASAARLTADRCIVVSAEGVREMKRAELAEMMKTMPYQLNDYGIEGGDVHVMNIGDDVAIVAYKVRSEYETGGKTQRSEAYDASVWVKRDGDWTCALHTETPAASKPPDGKVKGSR